VCLKVRRTVASCAAVNRTCVVLLLTGCLFGCPGTKEKLAQAALAEGCYINSDCGEPLVCAFRRCHNACTTERDCPAGPKGEPLNCVASDRPYKVCLLPQESVCVYNTDCPPALLCAVDLRCHTECVTERDCVSGQLCASGSCANPAQVADSGMLIPAVDAGTPPGAPRCSYNSDCASPLVCKSGACLDECKSIRDCRAGEECQSGSCVLAAVMSDGGSVMTDGGSGSLGTDGGSGSGNGCLLNSDCPGGEICGLDNRCRYQCVEARDCAAGACCYQRQCRQGQVCSQLLPDGGLLDAGVYDGGQSGGTYCLNDLGCGDNDFCNGIELCVDNRCRPSEHPICDDFNPCTVDMCNATNKTCAYATNGDPDAGDEDKDGHKAFRCGGGSDDCDDTNPNVFFGHPEDCDFVDNNCNGSVDEGLWRERAGARISLHGTARYPWWGGRPSIVRLDGGYLAVVTSDTIDGALEAFRLDNNLALVQGPVQIFKSNTQWVSPPGTPTHYGRRLLRPSVAINPGGEVVMSAWKAEVGGATGCPVNEAWAASLPVFRTDGLLSNVKAWDTLATDSSPACTTPADNSPGFSAAAITWSPGASRWIALWGVTAGAENLTATYLDSDGGVVNRHKLLQAPDPLTSWNYGFRVRPPEMAAGPSNVLVAFTEYFSSKLYYVLMDPSLNARISPVEDIFTTGFVAATGVAARGYYLATRTSGSAPTTIRFISPDGGALIGSPWTLEARAAAAITTYIGANTTQELAIAPLEDGLVYVDTDWPNADFGFVSPRSDGGSVYTTLLMSTTPRSGFAIQPMDSRTVGVLWTDGELKRTVMECVP
jgi:hypothetical protein